MALILDGKVKFHTGRGGGRAGRWLGLINLSYLIGKVKPGPERRPATGGRRGAGAGWQSSGTACLC